MKSQTIKFWASLHSVSSLLCSAFLLMLALTGMPLIFEDELHDWLNPAPELAAVEQPIALQTLLDDVVEPGWEPLYVSFDHYRPVVNVTVAPQPANGAMAFTSYHLGSGQPLQPQQRGVAVLEWLLQLHTDLFLGLPGMLFLGGMGLLFVIAMVSGLVLYAPYMRKQPFATVRSGAARLRRLDYHNLLGVMAAAWLLVVSLSGVINTLETPLLQQWRAELLATLPAAPVATAAVPLDEMVAAAQARESQSQLQFIAFPGSPFATAEHYAIYFHGTTPLTERIITPVLVAASGELVETPPLPWYLQLLSLARPLHFGDYGGWGLKLLWALLNAVAIALLWSGLRLWWQRRGSWCKEIGHEGQ